MENRSHHSSQSSYSTGIKNTIHVEANVLSMYAKIQLIPLMVSEKIFKILFESLPFMWPWQPIKLSDLDKSHVKRGGLLN